MSYLKINQHRAVIDCDGVLLDFDRSFCKVACDTLGRNVAKACSAYSLDQRYGLSKAEFARVWDAMDDHPSGWSGLEILPGAREAIHRLRGYGMEIHMVTGIESHRAQARLENLALHGLEIDSLECVGNGTASKADKVAKIAPVMFVDDRLHLLHESPFVPDRVWIDHGDEQAGYVVTEEIIRSTSLLGWVEQWERLQAPSPSRSRHLRLV